jgi:hypothetical protein
MNESEYRFSGQEAGDAELCYYAGEYSDAELHAIADAGEFHLDKDGFVIQLTRRAARPASRSRRPANRCREFQAVVSKPQFWKE